MPFGDSTFRKRKEALAEMFDVLVRDLEKAREQAIGICGQPSAGKQSFAEIMALDIGKLIDRVQRHRKTAFADFIRPSDEEL